jgi:hypothetical protein
MCAQVSVGDNVKLNLSGDLTTGYNGTFGDSQITSHSLDFGGSGSLHGYFYNPQFLSFDVQPYYNRSQANSSYASLTDSNGVFTTANIFSGSHFPGSVSFSRAGNSTSQFGLPGVTGLDTTGTGNTFNASWSASLPNLPTLNVSYLFANEADKLLGTDNETHTNSRNFNIHSDYATHGFMLNGFYILQSNDRDVPEYLIDAVSQPASSGTTHTSSLGAMISHPLFMHGYWTANLTHNGFGSDTSGNQVEGRGDGTNNAYSTSVSLMPINKLGVSVGASYQDNVFGALQQQLDALGAATVLQTSSISSQAMAVRASADYQAFKYLRFNGQVNHTEQYLGNETIGVTQYGGGISTSYGGHMLGSFTFSLGAMDTATQVGNSGASMYGNIGYSRAIGRWEAGADVNYSQMVQTLGNLYVTSMYGYGGSLKRKFGDRTYWTSSAREAHSGISQQSGTSSHSESFLTTLLHRGFSVNAVYSRSGGASILTSQGLVAVPGGIPTPVLASPVLYGARSFGGGASATVSRFALTTSYSKALSDTTAATSSHNSMTMWNALLRCRMRKLYLQAGFTKFQQSVSAANAPASMLNSYYFGVSRWFNLF